MTDSVRFLLPNGQSADVAASSARLICDRLWDLGIQPGASTAAARISEALHTHHVFSRDATFSEREMTPLIEAAQVHPYTWMALVEADDLALIPSGRRAWLTQMCADLIARLTADTDHGKVSALIADLKRLQDNLHATH